MKTILYITIIVLLIIIGWLIPIDGPFDIKPEEVIQQYENRKHKNIAAPIIKKNRIFTQEELDYIDYLEEQYQTGFLLFGKDN